MSKVTGISWTDHTWNPWEGCSKVSPGCANCYMFSELRRYGRDSTRVHRTKTWEAPLRWNEEARRAGRIDKVFTCSLSDFFHEGADAWRPEAWRVIRRCENLVFQVLTKRPLLVSERLPPDWGEGYPNVWLGVSIESNDYVWRADVLREIPARVRWVSAEPLLGPLPDLDLSGFQWIVVGGESGPGHRDMDHAWARQLRDRAKAQGLAYFFKQSGGARSGRGDLLDGRRWREFPSVTAPANQEPDEDTQPEEVPVAGETQEADDGRQQQVQREEMERLRADLERAQKEVESLRAEQHQRKEEIQAAWAETWVREEALAGTSWKLNKREKEVKSLETEIGRLKVQGESLRADLEKQRQQAAVERKDWAARVKKLEDDLSDTKFHLSMERLRRIGWEGMPLKVALLFHKLFP